MMFVDDTIGLAQVMFLKCTLLFSFVWIFRSKETVTKSNGGCGRYLQNICCLLGGIFRSNCYQILEGGCSLSHVHSQQ